MGNPNTGEVYEGLLRDEGDVPLNQEQAEWLKSIPVRERIAELQEMQAKLQSGDSKPPEAPSALRELLKAMSPEASTEQRDTRP